MRLVTVEYLTIQFKSSRNILADPKCAVLPNPSVNLAETRSLDYLILFPEEVHNGKIKQTYMFAVS